MLKHAYAVSIMGVSIDSTGIRLGHMPLVVYAEDDANAEISAMVYAIQLGFGPDDYDDVRISLLRLPEDMAPARELDEICPEREK